jgi:DNA-binding Lrp family transcriptional regulator
MRLTDQDREILASAYFQAGAPLSKVAQETGIPQHTVRRSLENLLESGYICRYAYINPSKLGFQEYYLSWRVATQEPQLCANLLQRFSSCEGVSWLAEIGAPFPYETVFFARNAHHVIELLNLVASEVGPLVLEKKISTLISFTSFVPKFLSKRSDLLQSISYRTDTRSLDIDELDHGILQSITSPTFTSYGQVARALGVAQSSLTYRIDRLKKEGVILGEGYLIQRSDLVGMTSFRMLAKLKKYSPETRKQLFDVCASHHAVYCLAELLGEHDLEFSARVHHPREIPAVVESLRKALPDTLGTIEFYPDIQRFKSQSYPFIKRPDIRRA